MVNEAPAGRRRSGDDMPVYRSRLGGADVRGAENPVANDRYRNVPAPTANAEASSTTAAAAINETRRVSQPKSSRDGRGGCTSRLSAAWATISGVIRLVRSEKPESSARSQIRLIRRGMPFVS